MKNLLKLLSVFFILSMVIVACGDDDEGGVDDPCEAITCLNGGTCVDGACECVNGYTGDRCQNEPGTAGCEACGNYEGNVNSDGDSVTFLVSGGIGLDNEVMDDTPFTAEVTENANSTDSLDMLVTLQLEIQSLPVNVPIDITVFYNATTKQFLAANLEKTIVVADAGGTITIPVTAKLVNFSGTVDGVDVDGTITLDDPDGSTDNNIEATLVFNGQKQ